MDRGGGLTELVIDPVLKDADKDSTRGQNGFFFFFTHNMVTISNAARISDLDGHFVLGEGSAPEQLVDTVDGEESCNVGT